MVAGVDFLPVPADDRTVRVRGVGGVPVDGGGVRGYLPGGLGRGAELGGAGVGVVDVEAVWGEGRAAAATAAGSWAESLVRGGWWLRVEGFAGWWGLAC